MPPKAKRKGRKVKKKKDPNRPKRAMSSFMFFANHKRAEVRSLHPDLKITDIGKKLGEMWKALDETEKKKYEDEAAKDKERYSHAMETYTAPIEESEEDEEEPKKKKKKVVKKKDPNQPKRAVTSFMLFASDKRAEVKAANPDMKVGEVGKKLAQLWKDTSIEEKKPWEDKAAKDKERYTQEMAIYKPPKIEEPEESSSSSGSNSESDSDSS